MLLQRMMDDWDHMPNFDGFPISLSLVVLILLACVVSIIVFVLIARFMYSDATKRAIPNPGLWLLAFLIFGMPALIIYLIVRNSYPSDATETPSKIARSTAETTMVNTYSAPVYQTVPKAIVETPVKRVSKANFCYTCGNKVENPECAFCPLCGTKL